MKRVLFSLAVACAFVAALTVNAQPSPTYYSQPTAIAAAVAASGPASAVRGLNVDKTYQVTGATSGGVGSAVVNIEGANSAAGPFDVIGTVTLTLGTTTTSNSFFSLDRYVYVRTNATTLTGTGANYSATMGY